MTALKQVTDFDMKAAQERLKEDDKHGLESFIEQSGGVSYYQLQELLHSCFEEKSTTCFSYLKLYFIDLNGEDDYKNILQNYHRGETGAIIFLINSGHLEDAVYLFTSTFGCHEEAGEEVIISKSPRFIQQTMITILGSFEIPISVFISLCKIISLTGYFNNYDLIDSYKKVHEKSPNKNGEFCEGGLTRFDKIPFTTPSEKLDRYEKGQRLSCLSELLTIIPMDSQFREVIFNDCYELYDEPFVYGQEGITDSEFFINQPMSVKNSEWSDFKQFILSSSSSDLEQMKSNLEKRSSCFYEESDELYDGLLASKSYAQAIRLLEIDLAVNSLLSVAFDSRYLTELGGISESNFEETIDDYGCRWGIVDEIFKQFSDEEVKALLISWLKDQIEKANLQAC
ncbi:hypothetical protein CXF85_08640 [Colwellia sp. 75C3]|uniref:hypothetical protein n=1 Tax=Colwellia sp. 75C3 TaxID=888425 RepID=UPI000C345F63|nr:hypothetical protein [Colwellia sp. 75C3]PKG84379.1 hypothetical protein CXF85_08640 [Colwellia sp. 75C3]